MRSTDGLDGAGAELVLDGRTVALSNLDRVLFPRAGWAKRELVRYYLAAAPVLLAHLRGHPLTLGRFPGGLAARAFLQNECRGAPNWMRTAPLRLQTGEVRRYCVVDDLPSLAWVANLAAVELHPYLVDAAAPEVPTSLVVDLDPGPGAGLADCCAVALRARAELAALGADPAVKTSGGAGLHLAVAVRDMTFAATREIARALAAHLAAERPDSVTDDARPRARAGRVLVDWLQNHGRRSTLAAYSLRAAASPRASVPLAWDEVEAAARSGDASCLRFTPAQLLDRVERLGDLYAAALAPARTLAAP
jgi:bifunctional non-homologous end joining protein LigD